MKIKILKNIISKKLINLIISNLKIQLKKINNLDILYNLILLNKIKML